MASPHGIGISGVSGSTSEEASEEPASQESQSEAVWPFLTQPKGHMISFLVNSIGHSESLGKFKFKERG